jgi:hypothetical protein
MECGSNNYDERPGVAAQLKHKRKFPLAVRAMAGVDIHFLSATTTARRSPTSRPSASAWPTPM